jgi:hypothetical protein
MYALVEVWERGERNSAGWTAAALPGGGGVAGSGGSVAVPNYYTGDAKVRRSHKDLAIDADPPRPMRAGRRQLWQGARGPPSVRV